MAELEIRTREGKLLGRLNDDTGEEELTEEWLEILKSRRLQEQKQEDDAGTD